MSTAGLSKQPPRASRAWSSPGPLLVGLVVGFAVMVTLITLILVRAQQHTSSHLSIEREVSGVVTKVSSNGSSVALRTSEGTVSAQVLTVPANPLQQGDRVTGTLVLIPRRGGGQEQALVVYSAVRFG